MVDDGGIAVERRFGTMSPMRMAIIAGSVLLWAVALIALLVVFGLGDEDEPEPVFGSLEGRFDSSIKLEYGGATLHYRENEVTNYLIIGVDQENVTQARGHQNGGQADFLLVLSIDRIRRTVTPVLLDSDTMVEVQTYGVFGHSSGTKVMQLCLAQAYSGVELPSSANTVETVERLLQGVVIDHYVALDVSAIPLLNDAIGGVEVTLQDDFTVYDPAMTKGATLRLTGEQAKFFVRGRITVADGTNASRMARQQQYLAGLLTQFHQMLQGDRDGLREVLAALKGHMVSDASESTLLNDVDSYGGYEWAALQSLDGEHRLDEYGFAEFWVDEDELMQLVATLWF